MKIMNKNLSEYKLIVFDMDGTLYFQRPLRLKMGLLLLRNIFSKGGLAELNTILTFRKIRDSWTSSGDVDEEQYKATAEKLHTDSLFVEKTIKKWIYDAPLGLLKSVRDEELFGFIMKQNELRRRTDKSDSCDNQNNQPRMVVYSDYPPESKLKALGIELKSYYSGQSSIGIMKPDPKGLRVIMSEFEISDPSEVIMIGDRECKDGEMADRAGCDKLILSGSKLKRTKELVNRLKM